MDVAGAVHEPRDLSFLGLVGGDRPVAASAPEARVVPAPRALDLGPGTDHRAVDVEGETAASAPPQDVADQFAVDLRQSVRGEGSLSRPAKRAMTGSPCSRSR